VDAAKIAHECSLQSYQVGVELHTEKIRLIRRAIMLEPQRAELWILLSQFLADSSPQKAQAIFKAYELEPENQDVQSQLIKLYLKNPKSYIKAFRVIVKSYQ
jgi:cytochrome c-type biogenesis protein CcmH/NrfG